jgi:hypothetical protein
MKKKIGLGATAIALSLGLATAGIAPAMAAGALSGGGATFQADFQAKCLAKFNGEKVAVNKGIDWIAPFVATLAPKLEDCDHAGSTQAPRPSNRISARDAAAEERTLSINSVY